MLILEIDLTKIDRTRIREITRKSGEKAKFYKLCVFTNDEPDKYDNTHVVKDSLTKEEREAKTRATILGNGKEFGNRGGQPPTSRPPAKRPPDDDPDF